MGTQWKVSDFIFGGSKITADGDWSHEIKRRLLLGRKVMTNLDSILKSRDITLPTKVCLVKAMVFPVVMYGCESWTVKKTEHWKIDTFELWYRRRLESPLDSKEIKFVSPKGKSTLNIHWKDWCWSWRCGTLANWCEELTHWKRPWCWKRLKAGGQGDHRGWDDSVDMSLSKLRDSEGQGRLPCCSPWGCKESDTTRLLNSNDHNG